MFTIKRLRPCGQHLFNVVRRSRPHEVETEQSELLDFLGREP
jgi:hypothetical protein